MQTKELKIFSKINVSILQKPCFLLVKILMYELAITAVTFFQVGYLFSNFFSSRAISIWFLIYTLIYLVVPVGGFVSKTIGRHLKLSASTYGR